MADGLTTKEEQFCHKFVELGEGAAAYSAAGHPRASPKTAWEMGSRWLAKPLIVARIAELREIARAAAEERTGVTLESIAQQLKDDHAFAREEGKPAAMVSATIALGKLYGLYVEKKDITVGMRPDEARQVIAALGAKLLGPGK